MSPEKLMSNIKAKCTHCGDCMLWDGAVNEAGLPRYGHGSARRRIWLAVNGPIVGPFFVGSSCGERRCLNPKHLVLRTKSSVVKSGQAGSARTRRTMAITRVARSKGKLNEQAAKEIRESTERLVVLAERYGVHFSLISKVRLGLAWRDLSSPFSGLGAR